MILFYPSTLPGEPLERHEAHGMTVEQWLIDNVKGYEYRDDPPISITMNGVVLAPKEWASAWIEKGVVVEIRPQPKEPATIITAVVAAVVAIAASFLLRPNIPTQSNKNTGRGARILEVNASGNQVKLGDVIPELAGRFKRFPDYLNAPRRRYTSRDVQTMYLMLCVGVGEYEINPDEVFIGNTPISQMGSDATFQIFGPGEDVSGVPNHTNWYNSPEVGPSTGSAGLRLGSLRDAQQSWDGTLTYQDDTITSSSIPSGWNVGSNVDVRIPLNVEIIDGGIDPSTGVNFPDIIRGDIGWLFLNNGAELKIPEIVHPDLRTRVITYTDLSTPSEPLLGEMTIEYENLPNTWVQIGSLNPGNMTITPYRNNLYWRIKEVLSNGFAFNAIHDGSVDLGWPGFPSVSRANSTVRIRGNLGEGLWTLPFAACPVGEVSDLVEIDILFPEGLVERGESSGNLYDASVRFQVQYRESGTSSWTTGIDTTITDNTPDQIGVTLQLSLPALMRPEIRMRRVNEESDYPLRSDRAEWYGMRARIPNAPSKYEGVTTMAVTVSGSDRISTQTDSQISVIATRKIPTRSNGQWTAPQATSDIAPWFAYIAKSAGYTDDDIDLDELDRLDTIWKARGDKFDFIEADDSTVKESMVRVLRAGMSELTIADGLLTPVRDEPREEIEHVYSAQNFTEEFSFSINMEQPDETDGIDVEYVNSETWTEEEVQCRLPGDNGFKVEKVRLDGVTSRDQAYQIGMRERRKLKYRRSEYGFGTELDALNSRYMGYNAIISDVPGQGQSMLCKSASAINANKVVVQVTEPLNWSAAEPHVVAWRRPDGTMAGPYDAKPGASEYQVLMVSSNPVEVPVVDDNMEWPHVYFGPQSSFMHEVLITSINPQGFESVSVEAANYDSRVYLDDNSPAPA